MGSVALDPVNPDIVYAGTGEENFSGDSYYGCGVLRSTDGGRTWIQYGTSVFDTATGGAKIAKLVVDPATAGSTTTTKVLVASDFGVYRSTNSGVTWTQVLAGTASDIVIDPTTPTTMYAALGGLFGSASNGIYKSTDGGVVWNKLTTGLPTANVGRINLSIAKSAPATLYAAVQDSSSGNFGNLLGIYKTTNSGTNWSQATATNAVCGSQCWYDQMIAVDPTNPNIVYFGAVQLYKSTDGGSTFANILNGIHVDQHAFAFDPTTATTVYAGNDGGIYRSTNGGASWSSLNSNIAITQFYAGASLHPSNASVAFGGTQDNGTLLTTGTAVWNPMLGGDGGFTAIDFSTPTTAYAETQWVANQSYIGPRRSDNLGSSSFVQKLTGISLSDRALFIPPLVMSPSNSQTLYFGTYRLYRTTNRADNWSAISGDLSKGSGNISAIAQAKSNSQVIYVGTNDGNVQVTTNGGGTWTPIISGLPNRYVTNLAVHPTDPQTAFVTYSGFGTGHVFKTTNSGATWTNISNNLPNVPVNTVLLDPAQPTTEIYLGTDLGVFRSTNGGAAWSAFNIGMPNVAILDLVYNPTTSLMVAVTHGRGMWKAIVGGGTRCTQEVFKCPDGSTVSRTGPACQFAACPGQGPAVSLPTLPQRETGPATPLPR